MPSYTGRSPAFGLFEKQKITPDGIEDTFILNYSIGGSSSLLVVKNGLVLEPSPGGEFVVVQGGTRINFSSVPLITDEIFVVYLGRELTVARPVGTEPIFLNFTGDGVEDTFDCSPNGPLIEARVVCFVDKLFQRPSVDFTVSGSDIIFTVAPDLADPIDVYITGVERADLTLIPNSIQGNKIFQENVVIEGNLTINGTEFIANVGALEIEDNEIILNRDYISGVPFLNTGIRTYRGDEDDGELFFDESVDVWKFGTTGNTETIAALSTVTNHTSSTSNPHSVTATQVGLGNLTNHSQLRREANDINSFASKVSLVDDDLILIEDSADSGNKKKVTVEDLGSSILSLLPPVPSGAVMPFAGAGVPSGWLFCHGQAVNRITYADLFAAIGTAFGVGDGVTTFNLPDTRKRFLAGKTDGFDIDGADILGGTGGSWLHTHDVPSHFHSMTGAGSNLSTTNSGSSTTGAGGIHTHAHTLSAAANGSHSHTLGRSTAGGAGLRTPGQAYIDEPVVFTGAGAIISTSIVADHTHTLIGTITNSASHTHSTPNHTHAMTGSIGDVTGGNSGDAALETDASIPSYILFNCIIKT